MYLLDQISLYCINLGGPHTHYRYLRGVRRFFAGFQGGMIIFQKCFMLSINYFQNAFN